jgi:hypothetical protein
MKPAWRRLLLNSKPPAVLTVPPSRPAKAQPNSRCSQQGRRRLWPCVVEFRRVYGEDLGTTHA